MPRRRSSSLGGHAGHRSAPPAPAGLAEVGGALLEAVASGLPGGRLALGLPFAKKQQRGRFF